MVPATPITHGLTWDEDATREEARERLNQFLAHLRDRGVAADGEVGDRDPVAAVRDAIRGREVDEVVLSTLPPGISRWLGQDVPSKLRHNVSVPVDVVYEAAPAAYRRRLSRTAGPRRTLRVEERSQPRPNCSGLRGIGNNCRLGRRVQRTRRV